MGNFCCCKTGTRGEDCYSCLVQGFYPEVPRPRRHFELVRETDPPQPSTADLPAAEIESSPELELVTKKLMVPLADDIELEVRPSSHFKDIATDDELAAKDTAKGYVFV